MADWLSQLWDTMKSVSLPLVVLGLSFQTLQTLFISLAWRNILRGAYPKSVLPYREVLSYYAGGAGLNSILPASAGTVAMLGLYRTAIAGSTVAGLVGATLVQNIFFVIVAALIYLWLFLSVAGSFDVKFGWFADHVGLTLIIVIGGAALIYVVGKILWQRLHHTWEQAKDGGGILTTPNKFMTQVVLVEAFSYAARMGVNATFMYAYHIPVSLHEHLPDRRGLVDLLHDCDRAGGGGLADGAGIGGAEGGGATEHDHRLHGRPGADHDGVERGVRPDPAGHPDRLETDARADPRQEEEGRRGRPARRRPGGRRAGGRHRTARRHGIASRHDRIDATGPGGLLRAAEARHGRRRCGGGVGGTARLAGRGGARAGGSCRAASPCRATTPATATRRTGRRRCTRCG